jgi:hypothetical protein
MKVLVGIPTLSNSSKDRYYQYLEGCKHYIAEAMQGVDYEVYVSKASNLPEWAGFQACENDLVTKFLSGGYDYLFHVELDVEVPPDSFQKLLSLDVDIACGYVRRHNGDGLILGFMDENKRVWYLPENAVKGNILSGWVMAGTSCILYKRRVFEGGLRFPCEQGLTPDISFMFKAQREGFVAKVHGDVLCGHLPQFPLTKIRS